MAMAIEAVDSRSARASRRAGTRRDRRRRARPPPRLAAARRARRDRRRYGLWAIDGITRHDPGGSALQRQALYAVGGALAVRRRALRRPAIVPPAPAADLLRDAGRDGCSCSPPGAATRGSKRWINVGFFTLPAVRVREGGVRRSRSPASSPIARKSIGSPRGAARRDRLRPACRSCSCSCSRTSARRSSTRRRSPRCCSSPACAGCTWRSCDAHRARSRSRCSGCCPQRASTSSSRTRRSD